ncbi:MAG TPA: type II secretion system protein GspN [Turneriella sp.]|nr:type II secretion system protein GspN [Turneriella sp.]
MTENELITEGLEESASLPTPPTENTRSRKKILLRAIPYLAGFFAFLLGLLFFAPLESYAYLALRQIAGEGTRIEVIDLSLSSFGNFKVQGIQIPLAGTGGKQGLIKIAELKGKISLLNALFGDKYNSHAEAVIFSFTQGDLSFKIDALELNSNLTLEKSGGTNKLLNGTFDFTAESAQLIYKEKKYLKEEIVIPFLKVTIKCRAQQGNIAVESADAIGRLVNAQIRGSIQVGGQSNLNLNIILRPTDEFFEKYQDKDPRTLLKFAGILQDDNRIELNVRGPMNAPQVTPVTVKPALPTIPSNAPTP